MPSRFPHLPGALHRLLEAPRDVTEGVALELVCCMKEAMQEVLNDRVPVEVEAGVYEDWGVTASNSIGD